MTQTFFKDGYADIAPTKRGRLVEELRRLKVQGWADPGDDEIKIRIAELEAEIAALDARGGAR